MVDGRRAILVERLAAVGAAVPVTFDQRGRPQLFFAHVSHHDGEGEHERVLGRPEQSTPGPAQLRRTLGKAGAELRLHGGEPGGATRARERACSAWGVRRRCPTDPTPDTLNPQCLVNDRTPSRATPPGEHRQPSAAADVTLHERAELLVAHEAVSF